MNNPNITSALLSLRMASCQPNESILIRSPGSSGVQFREIPSVFSCCPPSYCLRASIEDPTAFKLFVRKHPSCLQTDQKVSGIWLKTTQ